jgi:hypothetical protein
MLTDTVAAPYKSPTMEEERQQPMPSAARSPEPARPAQSDATHAAAGSDDVKAPDSDGARKKRRPRIGRRRKERKPVAIHDRARYRQTARSSRERRLTAEDEKNPRLRIYLLSGSAALLALIAMLVFWPKTKPDILTVADRLREAQVPYSTSHMLVDDGVRMIVYSVRTTDLEPLRDLPLNGLRLEHPEAADLEPLRGMPIRCLLIRNTQVRNLEPLRGMPLEYLDARDCPLEDLAPLAGLPLINIGFTETETLRGVAVLRDIPTLRLINRKPAKGYWAARDRQAAPDDDIKPNP